MNEDISLWICSTKDLRRWIIKRFVVLMKNTIGIDYSNNRLLWIHDFFRRSWKTYRKSYSILRSHFTLNLLCCKIPGSRRQLSQNFKSACINVFSIILFRNHITVWRKLCINEEAHKLLFKNITIWISLELYSQVWYERTTLVVYEGNFMRDFYMYIK